MKTSPEFFYHRKDGRDKSYAFNMSLTDLAIEPSYIARKIYQAMMKQNPEMAEGFKSMVIDAITSPITWDLTGVKEPDISAVITVPDKPELPN